MNLDGERIVLFLTGAMFVPVGAIYLIDPHLMYGLYGEPLSGSNAYHLVRTSAGAPLLLSGLAMLAGAFRTEFRLHALWIHLVMVSSYAFGRLWSFAAEGLPPSRLLFWEVFPEIALASLTIWFLWRRHHRAADMNR